MIILVSYPCWSCLMDVVSRAADLIFRELLLEAIHQIPEEKLLELNDDQTTREQLIGYHLFLSQVNGWLFMPSSLVSPLPHHNIPASIPIQWQFSECPAFFWSRLEGSAMQKVLLITLAFIVIVLTGCRGLSPEPTPMLPPKPT